MLRSNRELLQAGRQQLSNPLLCIIPERAAEILSEQLGCSMEGIDTKAKIGIGTIFLDQVFNRSSDQEPVQQNLAEYDPIILVTPIWLLRLSSPARTFIKQGALKGKQVYLFTVSGGPLSRGSKDSFREFGAEHGLTVREVHSMQVGKKAPAVLEKELQEIVDSGSLKKYRTTIAGK